MIERAPEDIQKITSANRQAWAESASRHRAVNQTQLLAAFSEPGYSCLDDTETERLNAIGVVGKNVAQVCCNNAREFLSIKNMGAARVVGFDGAQAFLDQGRELADVAGQDMELVCADIYDINDAYEKQFDLVTITIGVLGWMPDLSRFFSIICGLLRPGGALFIYEQHPILDMFEVGAAGDPAGFELSYFEKKPYVENNGLDYYSGEKYDAKPVTSFQHTMAEIIMAGVNNGVSVEWFEERAEHISNTWYNVESANIGVPMSYTLVFRKSR